MSVTLYLQNALECPPPPAVDCPKDIDNEVLLCCLGIGTDILYSDRLAYHCAANMQTDGQPPIPLIAWKLCAQLCSSAYQLRCHQSFKSKKAIHFVEAHCNYVKAASMPALTHVHKGNTITILTDCLLLPLAAVQSWHCLTPQPTFLFHKLQQQELTTHTIPQQCHLTRRICFSL